MTGFKIILGSSSRTRRAVLKEMGYDFDTVTADIDERAIRKGTPEELVMALADAKAEAIIPKLKNLSSTSEHPILLITADQVVVNEGFIREKPENEDEARLFIAGYSRAPAVTVSAVQVTNLLTGAKKSGIDKVEVYFHPIPEEIVNELINEGTVYQAAGGLLVEHPLISPLVQNMVGTIDSVMGLPRELTKALISEALDKNSFY